MSDGRWPRRWLSFWHRRPLTAKRLVGNLCQNVRVLLAYYDESGDQGREKGSATYTLGGVLVDADDWPDLFDELLELRRSLRDQYRILLRHEVKSNYLIRGSGDLAGLNLSPSERRNVWEQHFEFLGQRSDRVRAYGVVIQKEKMLKWRNPREVSWEYALQRLHQTTRERQSVMIIHDEGDNAATRQLIRKARRLNTPRSAFGTGSLGNQPIRQIIDDAVPRNSAQSYFLQLADLVAYAAFRTVISPSANVAKVCPPDMWSSLQGARWSDANGLARAGLGRGDQPGVVVWPKS